MNTGKVKFFDEKKGYGFIINNADLREYFFHATNIVRTSEKPINNDVVSFEIESGKRGLQDANVKKI